MQKKLLTNGNAFKHTVQIVRGVKEVARRNGKDATSGREVIVGNPKSATSRRVVPLNKAAVAMVQKLREEIYFGENSTILRLSPKQIANLLGHTTSEITELYYIRNDPTTLEGITDGFDV